MQSQGLLVAYLPLIVAALYLSICLYHALCYTFIPPSLPFSIHSLYPSSGGAVFSCRLYRVHPVLRVPECVKRPYHTQLEWATI